MSQQIWGAYFSSNYQSAGTGIVIIDEEKVAGGTSSFYYTGTCKFSNNMVSARLFVKKFAPGKAVLEEGLTEYTLILSGVRTDNEATLNGHIQERPDIKMHLRLKKLEDLLDFTLGK